MSDQIPPIRINIRDFTVYTVSRENWSRSAKQKLLPKETEEKEVQKYTWRAEKNSTEDEWSITENYRSKVVERQTN